MASTLLAQIYGPITLIICELTSEQGLVIIFQIGSFFCIMGYTKIHRLWKSSGSRLSGKLRMGPYGTVCTNKVGPYGNWVKSSDRLENITIETVCT